jgi:DNA-binding MarR family transcriptional regulator
MTATKPRWLTADELAGWRALAGVLVKLPAVLDAQLQRDSGLNHFEYTVLVGLSEADGRTMRMSELAGFTAGSLSRLSHVVTRMEQRGWVRREPCPADGRFTNAILTDAGWDKMVATAPGHVEQVRTLVIDALTPEQTAHLRDIGATILARIDAGTA